METEQGHSNRYALSGKLKCGECGSSLISRKRVRKDGSVNKYWCCYTATNEGKRHKDSWGNQLGCDLGKAFPDELGLNIVQQALDALHIEITFNYADWMAPLLGYVEEAKHLEPHPA